jgi:repressor LexA
MDLPNPSTPAPVGSLIAHRRRGLGLTLQQLATRAGCARSYLSLIENGRRAAPGEEMLGRLESALAMEPGTLLRAARWQATPPDVRDQLVRLKGRERAAQRLAALLASTASAGETPNPLPRSLDDAYRSGELRRLIDSLSPGHADAGPASESAQPRHPPLPPSPAMHDVPLINKVAAGYPREFTDLGYPTRIADEYVRCPGLTDPDAFACRVVGDSMLPEYREGDIVVFSPAKAIRSGMDCFARIEPIHESTFKRIYFEMSGDGAELIRLQPLNPAYPPRVLSREEVAGLYAAVSVTRELA